MYTHYRYNAPAPYEVIVWQLVDETGWTLDYIESLPLAKLHEWIALQDAKAKNAESRRGRR